MPSRGAALERDEQLRGLFEAVEGYGVGISLDGSAVKVQNDKQIWRQLWQMIIRLL